MSDNDPKREQNLAQFRVKINGSPASADLMEDIIEVVVDQQLHLPAMFEIHIYLKPHDMKWLDGATIDVGKEVAVLVGYQGSEETLITGMISSVEPDFDEKMSRLVVRGYDKSFKLHRGTKTRTFLQQSDSDIVSKMAGEAGLSPKVDSTTVQYEYLIQHAQSNYEFLLNRARRIGFEVFVDKNNLVFRKPKPNGAAVALEWGKTLMRFSPRLSVGEQLDSVEVRGWDVQGKAAIVGQASSGNGSPKIGESKTGKALATQTWGAATQLIADRPIIDSSEATNLAQATLDDVTAGFVQATGECAGNPKVIAGSQVEIKGVGTKFGGTYYLTAVRHTITTKDGHVTAFTACSRTPSAISTILVQPEERKVVPTPVIGIVTNNNDPEKLARVKVKFPWLNDSEESWWCRLATPMAGAERGYLTIPEVNDEVLVVFEHGDPTRGFVIGALWNGQDKPPAGTKELVGSDGKVNQRIWRSRTGHLMIFDDSEGEEAIRIIDKTEKNYITIWSKDNKLEVTIEGDIEVTSKTGMLTMTAEKDITIESKTGKIAMTAQTDVLSDAKTGKMSMTAQADVLAQSKTGKLDMKCVNAELNATANAKMHANANFDIDAGAAATLKANASAEVNGAATAKLTGGIVNVQGQGVTNISGPLVKIN
jgi:phage protein D